MTEPLPADPPSPAAAVPSVSEAFSREYGCTQDEWLRWMPDAVHGHPWTRLQPCLLEVRVGAGTLTIGWTVLPPRAIALIRLARMAVDFRFDAVAPSERTAFMRRFDLHLQRGGG